MIKIINSTFLAHINNVRFSNEDVYKAADKLLTKITKKFGECYNRTFIEDLRLFLTKVAGYNILEDLWTITNNFVTEIENAECFSDMLFVYTEDMIIRTRVNCADKKYKLEKYEKIYEVNSIPKGYETLITIFDYRCDISKILEVVDEDEVIIDTALMTGKLDNSRFVEYKKDENTGIYITTNRPLDDLYIPFANEVLKYHPDEVRQSLLDKEQIESLLA